jgi:hypothetical protein
MARRLLAGVVVAAALGAVGTAAGQSPPLIRAANAVDRHLVLKLTVNDLRPTELAIAKRRAVDADGVLLAKDVRVREAIRIPASAYGVVRWRSQKALRPGVYFVQVTAVASGVVTDCPPFQRNCNERWSSVLRVVVRAPR